MSVNWQKASKVKTPANSSGFLLWQVYHLWHRRINSALKPLKLTHMQFVLLACTGWLTREKILLKQKQLSDFANIDVMTVSQVLRTLEKKGLVIRESHPNDPRSHSLRLSTNGAKVLERALPIVEELDSIFLDFQSQNIALILSSILKRNSKL